MSVVVDALVVGLPIVVGTIVSIGLAYRKSKPPFSKKKKEPAPSAAADSSALDDVDTTTIVGYKPRHRPPKKYEVLGVPTNYIDRRNLDMYHLLLLFQERLQYPREKDAFANVIESIDGLYGIERSLNGLQLAPRHAETIQFAHVAANRAVEQLKEIVVFHTDDNINPSVTKRNDMNRLVEQIKNQLDHALTRMHRQLAAKPYYGEP